MIKKLYWKHTTGFALIGLLQIYLLRALMESHSVLERSMFGLVLKIHLHNEERASALGPLKSSIVTFQKLLVYKISLTTTLGY